MWACDGRIDLLMGAEVKDCSVANRSDFGLAGRFPGVCVCDRVCVTVCVWIMGFQVKSIGAQKRLNEIKMICMGTPFNIPY